LILELDDRPAMPYLLSLLPPQTEEDRLNPIPLVAKLPGLPKNLGSLYLNVLGGSHPRGGIALDPLVASGRLSIGAKVEFGQLRQVYLPTFRPAQQGVHIQFEVLSHCSRRYKPGWKQAGLKGDDKMIQVGFKMQQRWANAPEFLMSKRRDYQGTKHGLFSAGSEGGFLVGERGVVPWLCRTRGSRVALQVTPHKKGERRIPRSKLAKHPTNPEAHLAQIEQKNKIRRILKERGLIITKKVVFLDDKRWTTIPVLRKKVSKISPRMREGQAKMEAHNRKQQRLKQQRKQERRKKHELEKYERRLRMWNARVKLRKLRQFKRTRFLHPDSKFFKTRDTNTSTKKQQLQISKSTTPQYQSSSDSQRKLRLERLGSLSPYLRRLLKSDPQVEHLLVDGALGRLPFFDWGKNMEGRKRFGFRARALWTNYRPSGFRRSGHQPGGFKMWETKRKSEAGASGRRNVVESGKIAITQTSEKEK
jgi:hypothetical protein